MVTKKIKTKTHRRRIYKAHKRIKELIQKHGKVRIIFQDWSQFGQSFMNNFRRRVIDKTGYCKVAYKSDGYTKYSGYSTSCFYSYSEDKSLNGILKAMKEHDGNYQIPIEVHYGWFFTKKESL